MKYFFDKEDNVERLRSFCNEWKGTPFRHHTGEKDFGCDCIHFIAKGLEHVGYGQFHLPWYSRDWHLNQKSTELLLAGIKKYLRGEILPPNDPRNGDIVLYKFGYTISHASWFLDGRVWQAMVGVSLGARIWKDEYWYNRRKFIYRIEDNG